MGDPIFYTTLAKYYDILHSYITYKKEASFILEITKEYGSGNKLLDMCCGTGEHIKFLKKFGFKPTGVDLNMEMLEIARKKNPTVDFVQADMKSFISSKKFDVIICYFNSILYNKNIDDLCKTLSNFYKSLKNNGLLIFDAVDKNIGLNPEKGLFGKDKNFIFRPTWTYVEDGDKEQLEAEIEFEIKIGDKTEKFIDIHKLGAFEFNQIKNTAISIGFEVSILQPNKIPFEETKSHSWRGVFVCRKI